jgi:transposase
MDCRSEATPTAGVNDVTLYVPFELSRSSWLVGVHSPGDGQRMSVHKLEAGDVAGVLRLIAGAKARLRRQGARSIRVVSCYEAGRDGFWLDRVLRAEGIENRVVDAASIAVPRQGRHRKTDRLDLRVLMALERGESECRVVRVPSVAEEDARRPGRERETLIEERGRHGNRLKAYCALHGIMDYEPLRADRRARLAGLRTKAGEALPPHLRAEMERTLDRLEQVLEQLKTLDAARAAQVEEPDSECPVSAAAAQPAPTHRAEGPPPGAGPAGPDHGVATMRALVKLKSIGPTQAGMFAYEVFYRDFDNRRQIGRFVGLDGTPKRSGDMARELGISKAGSGRVRKAAVEQARLWLRYQPESALSRWFRQRTAGQSGVVWRKMLVALARKLIVMLWRYVRFGVIPEGAQFKPA